VEVLGWDDNVLGVAAGAVHAEEAKPGAGLLPAQAAGPALSAAEHRGDRDPPAGEVGGNPLAEGVDDPGVLGTQDVGEALNLRAERRSSRPGRYVLGPRHRHRLDADAYLTGTRGGGCCLLEVQDVGGAELMQDEGLHDVRTDAGGFAMAWMTSGLMPPLVPQTSAFSCVRGQSWGCHWSSTTSSSAVYSMTLPTGSVK